jgi:hypothetical protein
MNKIIVHLIQNDLMPLVCLLLTIFVFYLQEILHDWQKPKQFNKTH